jgi:hypothetical protein
VSRHFIIALPLISCWGPLQAATLERLSLDDMIARSHTIVRGTVASSGAMRHGSEILTHYRVQVVQRWKGPETGAVEFVVPGGKVNGVRQVCPGAPEIIEGKEYVLFLWTSRKGLTYITGLTQGLFEAPKSGGLDGLAVREASSETMLDAGTGKPVQHERLAIPFRDLHTRISTSVSRGGTQ